MGLRCLLGHDFGETEVEREREEDGNEMVVTIREVKTCNRCGERRVVSENKEVTSIRSPEEVGLEDEADEPVTDAAAEPEPNSLDDSAEPATQAIDEAESDSSFEPPQSAEEDDGIILDEDDAEPERERGQWPDDETSGGTTPMQDEAGGVTDAEAAAESGGEEAESAEPAADADETTPSPADEGAEFIDAEEAEGTGSGAADVTDEAAAEASQATEANADEGWPDPKGEDEGFAAEPGSDDDLTFGGSSLTPEVEGDQADEEDAEFIENAGGAAERAGGTAESQSPADQSPESDIARAERASFDLSAPAEGAESVFYCPNCEMTRPAQQSSLRPGDICPECRKGYLTEREP